MLPVRVSKTGELLAPSGKNPYELPWVQGAAATLPRITRIRYAERAIDLNEKRKLLKACRPEPVGDEVSPVWGPRNRPTSFRSLEGRPLLSDSVDSGGFTQ